MKRARQLKTSELAYIVDSIHRFMFLDEDGAWDRELDVNGGDLVAHVCELLENVAMTPDDAVTRDAPDNHNN